MADLIIFYSEVYLSNLLCSAVQCTLYTVQCVMSASYLSYVFLSQVTSVIRILYLSRLYAQAYLVHSLYLPHLYSLL